jgi:hypothetical protein
MTPQRGTLSSHSASRQGGFTALAMAGILLVASITVTLLLPNEREVAMERQRVTQERMNAIAQAMDKYVLLKGNLLPCPARVDRVYSAPQFQRSVTECHKASSVCNETSPTFRNYDGTFCRRGSSVVAGAVPVTQLNLGEEYMLDGWGNKIIYVVDTTMTRLAMQPANYNSPIQLYGIDGNAARDLRGRIIYDPNAQRLPALLISTGINGNGAVGGSGVRQTCNLGADDGQNCDFSTDLMLYTADRARSEDGQFDDIIQPIILQNRSCQEPQPCIQEKCTTFGVDPNQCAVPTLPRVVNTATMTERERLIFSAKGNVPEGCVHRAVAPATSAWPVGAGNNIHGSIRVLRSGGNIICCDGTWRPDSGGGC